MNLERETKRTRLTVTYGQLNWKTGCGISVLTLFFWCQACLAQNTWCRFRGPNGTGISAAKTIPTKWTDDDYNWKVDLPGVGHSSPVIWKNRIFTTTGDPKTGTRSMLCLDVADGHTLWQSDFPAETYSQHGSSSYASATPVVDEHGVVVLWTTPTQVLLVSLDLQGQEMWRRDMGPFIGPNGSGTSPIIVDDLVVVNNDQDDVRLLPLLSSGKENPNAPVGVSSIIAVDRHDGRDRWQLPRKSALAPYCTPCVRQHSNGHSELILVSTAHGITGIDSATGRANWEVGGLFTGRCVASPILVQNSVYASHGHGTKGDLGVAIKSEKDGANDESSLAYELKKAVPLVPTPLFVDGLLFLWADGGVLSCVEVESGTLLWRERVGGNYYGSPVWVNNRLYCIAKNGDVVVVAATPEYEFLARIPLGEDSFATPAVSDGVMYLRTFSQLLSLGG